MCINIHTHIKKTIESVNRAYKNTGLTTPYYRDRFRLQNKHTWGKCTYGKCILEKCEKDGWVERYGYCRVHMNKKKLRKELFCMIDDKIKNRDISNLMCSFIM